MTGKMVSMRITQLQCALQSNASDKCAAVVLAAHVSLHSRLSNAAVDFTNPKPGPIYALQLCLFLGSLLLLSTQRH